MFNVLWNGSDSSYEALLAHGLQTLFSYTWAHAIDDASSDAYPLNLPANYAAFSQERGSSDYDIRRTFSGSVSYDIPAPASGKWKTIFGNWSADSIVYARSASPVNVVTGLSTAPIGQLATGATGGPRPNLVP
jgi:hypothetical protein